jgi:hypothetical protein
MHHHLGEVATLGTVLPLWSLILSAGVEVASWRRQIDPQTSKLAYVVGCKFEATTCYKSPTEQLELVMASEADCGNSRYNPNIDC